MGGPPQTDYVSRGSFPPSQTHILLAFIGAPERLIGPVLVSGMVDLLLMGVVMTQTWTYHVHYSKDSPRFRILVCLLFLVSLAQSSAIFGLFFRMFSVEFGMWDRAISSIGTLYSVVLVLETLAGALSQLFFLERALTLVKLQWPKHRRAAVLVLVSICGPLILAGVSLGFACSAVSPNAGKLAASSAKDTIPTEGATDLLKNMTTSFKSITFAVDLSLTATIITCLTLTRTGRRSTDSLLRSLARGIIEAQTLPLLASLCFLIGSVIDSPGTFPAIAANLEGKVAALSVLHVLVSRASFKERPFVQSTGNLDDFSLDGPSSSAGTKGRGEPAELKVGQGGMERGRVRVTVVEGGADMSRKDGLSLEGSLREDGSDCDEKAAG